MKTNDLAIISSVAMATAALTVAFFLPGSLNAGNDNAPAQIVQPKLVSNGVEFTLVAAGNKTFKAGDEPVFELKAVNTTDEGVDATVLVLMTSEAPPSRISRIVMIPSPFWQTNCALTLKAGETKVIALDTTAKLPANSMINVTIQAPPQQQYNLNGQMIVQNAVVYPLPITALSYSTLQPAPTAKPE